MVRLSLISSFLRKHKFFTCFLFTVGLLLLWHNMTYAYSGSLDIGGTTYNFSCPDNWYNSLINSQYFDSHYYYLIYGNQVPGYQTDYRVLIVDKNTYNQNQFNVVFNLDTGYVSFVGSSTVNYLFNAGYSSAQNPLNNLRSQSGVPDTFTSRSVHYINGAFELWSNYDTLTIRKNNVDYRVRFPGETIPFIEPTLAGGDSLITVTTELGGISVYGGSIPATDSMTIKFYNGSNNTNISDLYDAYTLNNNSGWYVTTQPNDAVSHPGESYFYITNRFMNNPLNNVNGNNYTVELTYPSPSGSANKTCVITFNLSADVQQNTQDNVQQDTLKQAEQTNAFLNSDKIDDSDIELPEMEADDFTFSFFSTAVTSIVDAMNSATSNESITIQFRGKTYTINSSDFNFLRNNGFTLLRDLLPILWIFSIGFMIYKDAHYRIQKLKEFNWHAMFTDDIQVDML